MNDPPTSTRVVGEAGGRVLLDQGSRPFGCHHQKYLVVRYARRGAADVAFVAGSTWPPAGTAAIRSLSCRAKGTGRPLLGTTCTCSYAGRPCATSRTSSGSGGATGPSPAALTVDQPEAGSGTVQILRTYPARPRRAFAPKGERSIARRYAIVRKTRDELDAARARGRPRVVDADKRRIILARHADGESIRTIARATKVSVGTVQKVLADHRGKND